MTRRVMLVAFGLAVIGGATVPAGRQGAVTRPSVPGGPALRFHHLHYRVGDPAAAMSHAADELHGSRVLLRGIGVGVRIGSEYVLFDRDASSTGPPPTSASPDGVYAEAVEWLRTHGLDAPAGGSSRVQISNAFRNEHLDHLAFTSSDSAAAVNVLEAHGARASRRTADTAFFAAAGGLTIEIVRDTEAPDAYWCPMHPDLRAAAAGQCPICRMSLVPIPAPRIGEYMMDVVALPGPGAAGVPGLRITLRDPVSGRPVTALATVHERLLHLFIIDRSLDYFAHVHPEKGRDGVFTLRHRLPPGEYVVVADFLPQGGTSQMLQRAFVTPGYHGPLFPPAPDLTSDLTRERTIDGVRVRLDAERLQAGKDAMLRFTLADAVTGAPVADLEPFLGAAAHMLIVNADLTEAHHAHPEEPVAPGPLVSFEPMLPAAGSYKLWVQFQRKGRVIAVPFVIQVAEP
jgi:hypothetical protein